MNFAIFKRKLESAASAYPNSSALVLSMQRRVALCIKCNWDMIKT